MLFHPACIPHVPVLGSKVAWFLLDRGHHQPIPFDRSPIDTQAPSSRKRQSIHPYTQPASQPAHLGCSSLKCRPLPSYPSQTVLLAAASVVVVVLLHEEVLVHAVAGKGDGRDAEAGEGVLEAVPPGEAACVAPRLAVHRPVRSASRGWGKRRATYALSHGS